jgi:hypothetical protein
LEINSFQHYDFDLFINKSLIKYYCNNGNTLKQEIFNNPINSQSIAIHRFRRLVINGCVEAHPGPGSGFIADTLPDGVTFAPPDERFTRDPEYGWVFPTDNFTKKELAIFRAMLIEEEGSFAYKLSDLTGYTGSGGTYPINYTHNLPITELPRRQSPDGKLILLEKCKEMLDAGMARPLEEGEHAHYSSNPHLPRKKDVEGRWTDKRVTFDLRRFNNAMIKLTYMIPRADDIWHFAGSKKYKTKLDLRSGYWQIKINPADTSKMCFWGPSLLNPDVMVLWKFLRLPMGSINSAQFFQTIMDLEIARAGATDYARSFADDCIICSDTFDEHLNHVRTILRAFKSVGLFIHPQKSFFGTTIVEHLGHLLSPYGTHPTEEKIEVIARMQSPTNVSELKSKLQFMQYYRIYMGADFSALIAPLNELTKKAVKWSWSDEHEKVFTECKTRISKKGLVARHIDVKRHLFLHTDWSMNGLAAILAQKDDDGHEYMCGCSSRATNQAEKNYGSVKGECLAAVWGVQKYAYILASCEFTLVTDHEPLLFLLKTRHLEGIFMRWSLILQGYRFNIVHKAGILNINADVLSRYPIDDSTDITGARMDHSPQEAQTGFRLSGPDDFVNFTFDNIENIEKYNPVEFSSEITCSQDYIHLTESPAGYFSYSPSASDTLKHLAKYDNSKFSQPLFQRDTANNEFSYACIFALLSDRQPIDDFAFSKDEVLLSQEIPTLTANIVHSFVNNRSTSAGFLHEPQRNSFGQLLQLQDYRRLVSENFTLLQTAQQARLLFLSKNCLSTKIIGKEFFKITRTAGLNILELGGGIGTGLELALREQFIISQYFYCDPDRAATAVIKYRIVQADNGRNISVSKQTFKNTFALPQLCQNITMADILRVCPDAANMTWLVISGISCVHFSAAGTQKGCNSPGGEMLQHVARITKELQQHVYRGKGCVAYLFENVSMTNSSTQVQDDLRDTICTSIGDPFVVDAARLGSYAHRLRCYWTNLADTSRMQLLLNKCERPEGREVNNILDHGRVAQPIVTAVTAPWYTNVGKRGQALQALPTFCASASTYAYSGSAKGMIYNSSIDNLTKPSTEERERAMGFMPRFTAAPALTDAARNRLLGNAMDMHALTGILLGCEALAGIEQPNNTDILVMLPGLTRADGIRTMPVEWNSPLMRSTAAAIVTSLGWRQGEPLGSKRNRNRGITAPIDVGYPASVASSGTRPGVGCSIDNASQSPYKKKPRLVGTPPRLVDVTRLDENFIPPYKQLVKTPTRRVASSKPKTQPLKVKFNNTVSYHDGTYSELPNDDDDEDSDDDADIDHHAANRSLRCSDTRHVPHHLLLAVANTVSGEPLSTDIWSDTNTMIFLKTEVHADGINARERDRVTKRARSFSYQKPHLFRLLSENNTRIVPQPNEREALVVAMHLQSGHFGRRRTFHLLANQYWFCGMFTMVDSIISKCTVCDRVKAVFNLKAPVLNSLPIKAMFYRFGADLCGPFHTTKRGNHYIMVVVEHLSRMLIALPIPNKTPESTTYAYKLHVLGKYGASAECLTDGGGEWQGCFDKMLKENFIDHRKTGADHPQSNGLVERAVGTIKGCLKKIVSARAYNDDWDDQLWRVILCYNLAPQKSTGLAPLAILHYNSPTLPLEVRAELTEEIDMCNISAEDLAKTLQDRAPLLQRHMAIAGQNISISQHRNELYYQRKRSGNWTPKLQKFAVGDFAYVKQRTATTLDIETRPVILKITKIDGSIIHLRGQDGNPYRTNVDLIAPCRLTNIIDNNDFIQIKDYDEVACAICESTNDKIDPIIMCDACNQGFHIACVKVKIDDIPPVGVVYICPPCRRNKRDENNTPCAPTNIRIMNRRKQNDEIRYQRFHGRYIRRNWLNATGRSTTPFWGRVEYTGIDREDIQNPYKVHWEDKVITDEPHRLITKDHLHPIDQGQNILCEGFPHSKFNLEQKKVFRNPIFDDIPNINAIIQSDNIPITSMVNETSLPDTWNLQTATGLQQALDALMPGPWQPQMSSRLSKIIHTDGLYTSCVLTSPGEIQRVFHDMQGLNDPPVYNEGDTNLLFDRIHIRDTAVGLDPFSGHNTIAKESQKFGYTIVSNDMNPKMLAHSHSDAAQPKFYRDMAKKGLTSFFITSPWFPILDIVLPLMVLFAKHAAFVHVPGYYISTAPRARLAFFNRLSYEQRIHFIYGLPRGPQGFGCVWICIFKNKDTKLLYLRKKEYASISF